MFIAVSPLKADREHTLDGILAFLRTASIDESSVRYPGERTLETRRQNIEQGIPVDEDIWNQIIALILASPWSAVAWHRFGTLDL